MSLTINGNFSEAENCWVFQPVGEVDISNAGQLKQQLETASAQRAADIRLDLSGLSYIDSTGLGVMISVYGEMKKTGHRIRIVNPKDNVKKLLRITSLYNVLVEE